MLPQEPSLAAGQDFGAAFWRANLSCADNEVLLLELVMMLARWALAWDSNSLTHCDVRASLQVPMLVSLFGPGKVRDVETLSKNNAHPAHDSADH